MKMTKFLRRYLPAVMSLVIITALAAVSFAEQQAAKNAQNELPEQASDKAKQKTEEQQGEGSTKANHGHCVSYAAHLAKENGLKGSAKGAFVSAVAKDKDAVTVKVAEGGTPDSECQDAINEAGNTTGAATTRNKGKSEENGSDSEERGKSAGKGKSGS